MIFLVADGILAVATTRLFNIIMDGQQYDIWKIPKKEHRQKGSLGVYSSRFDSLLRCYVGIHYPSDVLVGMIVGTLVSFGVYKLLKKYVKTDFIKKRTA